MLTMMGKFYPTKPAKPMGKLTLSYGVAQIAAPLWLAPWPRHYRATTTNRSIWQRGSWVLACYFFINSYPSWSTKPCAINQAKPEQIMIYSKIPNSPGDR